MKQSRILFCLVAILCLAGNSRSQKPQLITEEGHTSVVRTLAFSPNGRFIASGSHDRKIKVWDARAKMEYASMAANGGTITSLAFVDDETIVSADDFGTIKLWSVTTNSELHTLARSCDQLKDSVPSVALSNDRKTLVVAGNREGVTLWDLTTRTVIGRPSLKINSLSSLAFDSLRGLIAIGSKDGSIVVWDISKRSGETLYISPGASEVSSLAFSPDGKDLVTGTVDGYVRILSAETSDLQNSWLAHADGVNSVVFEPRGKTLISGGNDNKIKRWQVPTGTEIVPVLEIKKQVRAVAVSPLGDLVAGGGNESSVTIWDAKNGSEIKKWEPHTLMVTDLVLSPDGQTLATAHSQNIKLWNLATGRELKTLRKLEDWILALSFSGDGTKVASCSLAPNGLYDVTVWDIATGQETFHTTYQYAYSVALNSNGSLLAAGNFYGQITVWKSTDKSEVRSWQIPSRRRTRSMVFDKNDRLISGNDDGLVRVWDINQETPKQIIAPEIREIKFVDISDDGTKLAVRGVDQVKIVNLENGQASPVSIPASNYEARVKFSPDGTKVAVGEYEFNQKCELVAPIRLWEVASGKLLKTMFGHKNGITAVDFSADGSRIISGGWDNTWKLWSIDSETELSTIIALDENEWVATMPDGRFDASPKGMEMMHWRIGDELINLSQLKERHWEPGLLSKLMSINTEPLVSTPETTGAVKLFPKIEYEPPQPGRTDLRLKLTSRNGGGIGRVQVKINNTEVYDDARGPGFDSTKKEAILPIDFKNASLVPGQSNSIQITAWNADGYLSSRTETREWVPEGVVDNSPPEFYALIVGVSEYSKDGIKLKYSAKDAEAMAAALELGARGLFDGPGRIPNQSRVHINLLRTSSDPNALPPTKANIKAAFEGMKSARPQDVVVVYFSGHGIAINSGSGSSQANSLYLFLTKEARSKDPKDYTDPAVAEQRTISSRELASWIRPVRALHRVLILDTCAAGAAATQLNEKGDDITSYQLRAIDRLQDRTGFFVLMGSASNSVSYEATKYGQSLLTYSLLRKMKTEQPYPEQIDVAPLFQHAVDDVGQLARGNNGIQKPEITIPQGGASFPIGLLTNDDKRKIKVSAAKPILLRPTLLSVNGPDTLRLTQALRKLLDKETYITASGSMFESDIVYVDADGYEGAYSPAGVYTVEGDQVKVNFALTRDAEEIKFEVTGSKQDSDKLLSQILEEIYKRLVTSPG